LKKKKREREKKKRTKSGKRKKERRRKKEIGKTNSRHRANGFQRLKKLSLKRSSAEDKSSLTQVL
jgi:hypothetical protein